MTELGCIKRLAESFIGRDRDGTALLQWSVSKWKNVGRTHMTAHLTSALIDVRREAATC